MLKLFENFKQKIYCDLDAVLCDFIKKFNTTLISNGEVVVDFDEYRKSVGYKSLWDMVEVEGVEYWSEMEWLPGGKELWKFLIQFDNLEILTGLPEGKVSEYAQTGKDIWCGRELGDVKVNTVIGGKNKYKFVKNSDILIDDLKRNCELWENAGGIAILHTTTENTIEELKKLKLKI